MTQYKRVYWPEQKRYVRLRISTKAMKTLNKLGLEENGAEPAKKDKRAPKGPKPLFVPKWKEAKLAKMDASAAAAEKKRFAEANNMIVA